MTSRHRYRKHQAAPGAADTLPLRDAVTEFDVTSLALAAQIAHRPARQRHRQRVPARTRTPGSSIGPVAPASNLAKSAAVAMGSTGEQGLRRRRCRYS